MAKWAESRDVETAGHLRRVQLYSVTLAGHLRSDPAWSSVVDDAFIGQLTKCAPLHDIGKLALPDAVLLKPGALSADERRIVETHTTIGSAILDAVAKDYGDAVAHLPTARAVVRHHHERW